ncbi:restriction endonuclease [Candidatus Gracilibacteria bacterium]|nr:restriction endonuclease [Candidatus Gracilibacteria bacterium]
MKKLSFQNQSKIKNLCPLLFWYRDDFYSFFANILECSKSDLEYKYPRNLNKYFITEQILHILTEEQLKRFLSELYNLKEPLGGDNNPNYREGLQKLKDFKKEMGNDILEQELKDKEFNDYLGQCKKNDELVNFKKQQKEKIWMEFLEYTKITENKQKRGFWLEKIFFDLMEIENIEHKRPYRTHYEQIDGSLKFDSFTYLFEAKWEENAIAQKDISIFDGKIQGKAQSTRGIFLSISGFEDSAVCWAQNKDSPRLIFIDGSEFSAILQGYKTMYELLYEKEYNLTHYGYVYKKIK